LVPPPAVRGAHPSTSVGMPMWQGKMGRRKREGVPGGTPLLAAAYAALLNITDIVEADGAGVMSVSLTVLPSLLRTKVFSRPTFPSWL
jgi:hypothetical protein